MKIKNAALNSLIYFLYMFGACLITMVVEALLVYIIRRFVVIPYHALTVIRLVIYSLAVPAILAVIGYYEGYREGACPVGEIALGGGMAVVAHLLFAMLFRFQAFVAGGVRFATGLFCHGSRITEELLTEKTPYGMFLLTFAFYGVIYIIVLAVARYLGVNRHIVDRAELRGHETDTPAE